MLHVIFVDTLNSSERKSQRQRLYEKSTFQIFFPADLPSTSGVANTNGKFEKQPKFSPEKQAHCKMFRFILTGLD